MPEGFVPTGANPIAIDLGGDQDVTDADLPLQQRTASIDIGQGAALMFTDSDGTKVTVRMIGGTATVQVVGTGLAVAQDARGATVTGQATAGGQDVKIADIQLLTGGATAMLMITGYGGDRRITVDKISGSVVLSMLNARSADLTGEGIALTGDGAIRTIYVGDLLNGADIAAPGAVTGSVTVMAGQIGANSNMTFGSPLGLLSIPGWAGPGTLTAPSAGTIMSRGDFGADVNLTGAGATGNSVNVFYCLGSLDGADLTFAGAAGTIMGNAWTVGSLTALRAATVMIRGNMGANVTMTGQNTAGTSLNMFYAMGDVAGSVVNLAGAAGVIYARSWTGGSIQALYVGSLLTTRGAFGADVNLTGANAAGNSLNLLSSAGAVNSASIVLAGGAGSIIAPAWAVGQFTARNVSMFMSRGDFTGNVNLTGQNRAGSSLNVFYVMGEMNGGLVRTRGGIGTAMIGSMQNSGVYACVLDGVAGMSGAGATAAEYFAAPLAGMQTPAIRMLMISRAAGVFANSVVAGPSMGTVILRGVATDNGDAAFGLVADTGITMLTRYRDGAAPSTARNVVAGLVDTLPAEDDFQVAVL